VDLSRFTETFLESSDRLCRYSSSIHRQMKQDTEQLDRVQRQRRKDTLPTLDIKYDSFDPYLPVDVLNEHQIEVSPGIIADFSTKVDTCNRSTSEIAAALQVTATETLPLREEGYQVTRVQFVGDVQCRRSLDNAARAGRRRVTGISTKRTHCWPLIGLEIETDSSAAEAAPPRKAATLKELDVLRLLQTAGDGRKGIIGVAAD
jgi:hypothetical protein